MRSQEREGEEKRGRGSGGEVKDAHHNRPFHFKCIKSRPPPQTKEGRNSLQNSLVIKINLALPPLREMGGERGARNKAIALIKNKPAVTRPSSMIISKMAKISNSPKLSNVMKSILQRSFRALWKKFPSSSVSVGKGQIPTLIYVSICWTLDKCGIHRLASVDMGTCKISTATRGRE